MSDPSILVIGARVPEGLGAWATGNGYVVHHASRAADGLERFDKVPTTLVLVQLRLEQLADLAVVARLRELPAGRTVPIVALCRAAELDRCRQFGSALRLNLWLPEPLDTVALAPWANPLTHSASGTFTRRRSGVLGEVEFTGRSPSSDAIPRVSRPPSSDANPIPPRSPAHATPDEPGAPRARDSRAAARPASTADARVASGPPPAVTTAAWPDEPTSSSRSTPPGLRAPPPIPDEAPAPRAAPPARPAAAPPSSPGPTAPPPAKPPAAPPPVVAPPVAPPPVVAPSAAPPAAVAGPPELGVTKPVPEYEVPTFDEVDELFSDD